MKISKDFLGRGGSVPGKANVSPESFYNIPSEIVQNRISLISRQISFWLVGYSHIIV